MPTLCNVTGTVRDRAGTALPNVTLIWQPAPLTYQGLDGDTLTADSVTVTTDAGGNVDFDIAPGSYSVTGTYADDDALGTSFRAVSFDAAVPDQAAIILANTIDQTVEPQAPVYVTPPGGVLWFASIADFTTWVNAGNTVSDGNTAKVTSGATVVDFIADSASAITGLPAGWKPASDLSVKHLNATGDGTTDDATAFTNAWGAVPGTEGEILVPPGTYNLATDVTPSGKTIVWRLAPGASLTGAGALNGSRIESVDALAINTQLLDDSRFEIFDSDGADDFSGYQASNGRMFQVTGRQSTTTGTPFLAAVRNDLSANSTAYPTAVAGVGYVDNAGNHAYAGFFKTITLGATGSTPGTEIDIFNESGVAPTDTFYPDESFSTTDQIPFGLKVAAGGDTAGAENSYCGVKVGREGGSSVGFDIGMLIDRWGARKHGIVVQSNNLGVVHQTLIDNVNGTGGRPQFDFYKARQATHGTDVAGVDGDVLGRITFSGSNDAGTPERVQFGKIDVVGTDVTDGSEDGEIEISAIVNGTQSVQARIGAGLGVGAGASREGAGTVNVTTGYFVDGTRVLTNRQSAVSSPSGGATQDAEARAAIDAIRAVLTAHGLTG